jgi:Zn-dependent M16 (insulinase) family peptidase
MNAMTGSDFTIYPFSSQNAQDFRNLLSVYTDSAFLPNLSYLDFRQEGHKLEFNDADDKQSGLKIGGVVYNEMKGAMSSPSRSFMQKVNENLFKKAQYKYNSGGEPKYITDLKYEELVDFHKTYYHPSNSTFFSYGDLDFKEHLKFVQEQVILPNFSRNTSLDSAIPLETQLKEPISKLEHFMPDQMSPAETQSKLGLSFLLETVPAENPYETFCLQILSQLLLEGPNTPFYKAIIEKNVAPQYCPGTGLDYYTRQAKLTLGVEGVNESDFGKIEEVIFKTLEQVKKDGIEKELFEQVLHEIEFSVKKTKTNTGLMYIFSMIPHAIHGGDPLCSFRINEFSERIRKDFEKGGLFENLVDKHLLSNPHYLKLRYTPDNSVAEKEEQEDKQKLSSIEAALTEPEKEAILEECKALKTHQETA